jgi:hypothetical protein
MGIRQGYDTEGSKDAEIWIWRFAHGQIERLVASRLAPNGCRG